MKPVMASMAMARPISMPRLIGLVYLPSYTLLSVLQFSLAKATVKLGNKFLWECKMRRPIF